MDSYDLKKFSDDQILDEANDRFLIEDPCLDNYSDRDLISEYIDRGLSSINSEIYDKSERIRQSINNRLFVTSDIKDLVEVITGRMCI
jgi:hypothetical protein